MSLSWHLRVSSMTWEISSLTTKTVLLCLTPLLRPTSVFALILLHQTHRLQSWQAFHLSNWILSPVTYINRLLRAEGPPSWWLATQMSLTLNSLTLMILKTKGFLKFLTTLITSCPVCKIIDTNSLLLASLRRDFATTIEQFLLVPYPLHSDHCFCASLSQISNFLMIFYVYLFLHVFIIKAVRFWFSKTLLISNKTFVVRFCIITKLLHMIFFFLPTQQGWYFFNKSLIVVS